MELILILFIICVGGGWLIGKLISAILFGSNKSKKDFQYIDRTTHIHHHYHDNRSVNINGEEFKNLKK